MEEMMAFFWAWLYSAHPVSHSLVQAIQALEKAMKLDSTFERAPLALSNIYTLEGKPEKAVEVYVFC